MMPGKMLLRCGLAAMLATVTCMASARLAQPTPAEAEAAAAKKAQAAAQAEKDKQLLAETMDKLAARWRANPDARGRKANSFTPESATAESEKSAPAPSAESAGKAPANAAKR